MGGKTRAKAMTVRADKVALLVIDVQERLAPAMPEARVATLVRNAGILGELCRRFSIPVVVSEQYPRGLGNTMPEVTAALAGAAVHRIEKTEFSVCDAGGFAALRNKVDRKAWLVAGMETHVCVYQTVRQLRAAGDRVFVLSDAVASRTADNRNIGLALMQRLGAVVISTEVAVFDVLRKAGGDDFRALSKLIR